MDMDGRMLAEENGRPIYKSVDALFNGFYQNAMKKSAGPMGYSTTGAVNPIYGQFISAVVFACDSAYTAHPVKQWDKTGIRVQTSLAKKGGLGTYRGGPLGTPTKPDLELVLEPYKEIPFPFEYDMGLMNLESKDDTIRWQDFIEIQGRTYSDAIDFDMLRPTEFAQPTMKGEEIQIERLSRIIASYSEIGQSYDSLNTGSSTTITASDVSPYGGTTSSLYPYRSAKVTALDAYVDNAKTTLDLADLDKAWSGCAPYWANTASPQNKAWIGSFEAQRRIGGLLSASNRYMESVFTTRDINGVKTVPGRDVGFVTKAYNDIPYISEGNINVDRESQIIPTSPALGDIYLEDFDHIWYKALMPVDFRTTDRYEIYDMLTNKAVFMMEGELCSDSWRGMAKITQKL